MNSKYVGRADIIDGLRQLAKWLEDSPSAGLPPTVVVTDYPWRKDQLRFLARLPGPWEKAYEGDLFFLCRRFGPGVEYRACALRSVVCRREVVGSEEVVLPAQEARPAETVKRDIVEWRCDEPLLAPEKGE